MSSKKQSSIPWNDDTRYALGLFRSYVSFLGFWPLERNTICATLRLAIFVGFQLLLDSFVIFKLLTIGYCGKIRQLVPLMIMMSLSLLSVLKILIPWFKSQKMHFLLESIVDDWARARNRRSHDVMMKFAYKGRVVCMFQLFMTAFVITRSILHTLPGTVTVVHANTTTISRIVPYNSLPCWVSTTIPVGYYKLYYSLLCLQWYSASLAYIGIDLFIFGLGMHVSGQFELLCHDLEKITGDENYEEQQRKFSDFIKRHNHLLKVAKTLEDVFNVTVFLEVVNNSVVLSLMGIIILWAIKLGRTSYVAFKIVRVILFYGEIFMVSYIGETLTARSEKLHEVIYNIPWYKISPCFMKNVIVIMMRVKYPCYLSAGKIIRMNYEAYKSIVKTTFSYFSVLRLFME